MGEFPDKYDYKTAQVPPPLSKEAEEEKASKVNEKKKAQRSAKREKEKVQKTEEQKVKNEKEEKDRFLNLSDREKELWQPKEDSSILEGKCLLVVINT